MTDSTLIPASAEEIIEVLWQRLRDGTAHSANWGTALDNSIWHVGTYTYINGIMLHVDFDFEGMWLMEVCFRDPEHRGDPTPVRWLAVATIHGDTRHAWYPTITPQYFFDRTVKAWDVIEWATAWYKALDLSRHG